MCCSPGAEFLICPTQALYRHTNQHSFANLVKDLSQNLQTSVSVLDENELHLERIPSTCAQEFV